MQGKNVIYSIWGKSDRYDPTNFKPLVYHLIESGAVAEYYWKNIVRHQEKRWLSETSGVDEEDLGRLIPYLTALHDIGKATPNFQKKIPELCKPLEKAGFPFPPLNKYHGVMTAKILENEWEVQKRKDKNIRYIARVIGGHHGIYPTGPDMLDISPNIFKEGKWSEAQQEILSIISSLFKCKREDVYKISGEVTNGFLIYLSGYITIMDWIASSDYMFMNTPERYNPAEHKKVAGNYAKRAFEHLQWKNVGETRPSATFEEIFGFSPRPLQAETENISSDLINPCLVLMEVPTGEGKTEAAFYAHEQLLRNQGQNGAYIALPTQATSNQMFHRLKEYLEKTRKSGCINLHLVHGKAMMSKEYEALRAKSVGEQHGEENIVANAWFSAKKRSLLSPYGVGTIDQALLSILKVKHFYLRLFALSNKTVIIDEVHAYDAYMSTLLERTLEWLREMNCSVILLSATLPSSKRKALLEKFGNQSIPILTTEYPRMISITPHGFNEEHIKTVMLDTYDGGKQIEINWVENEKEMSKILEEKLEHGGNIAIILNTVKKAQNTYLNLKELLNDKNIELSLLHSQFPFKEKEDLEEKCLTLYGKEREENNKKRVLISTQIIEQSLDIDFDLMVSDIAPIDLLIQRAGRLHRHQDKKRAGKMSTPQLLLLKPRQENSQFSFGPSKYVYAEYILLKTYLILENKDTINIPKDVEELIEAIYESEEHETYKGHEETIKELKHRWERQKQNDRDSAKVQLIKPPNTRDFLKIARNANLEDDSTEAHESFRAMTRKTRKSISLICLYEKEGKQYLEPQHNNEIDLKQEPDHDATRKLLENSFSTSNYYLVKALEKVEEPITWKNNSLLKDKKPLWFKTDISGKHIYMTESLAIEHNPELGILVETQGNKLEL